MLHVNGGMLSGIRVDASFILQAVIDWLLRQRLHKSGGYGNLWGYWTFPRKFDVGTPL